MRERVADFARDEQLHRSLPTREACDYLGTVRWNPSNYLVFAAERSRPAVDLLARVRAPAPTRIVDLGSGAGNVTRLLCERWPEAEVVGVDHSPEMLETARKALPRARFLEAEIQSWQPATRFDVVFSNAALHWVADHAALFPRLVRLLAPGGWLAVQMPASFDHLSHLAADEALVAGAFEPRRPIHRAAVHPPEDYFGWLAPFVEHLDLWDTTYLHVLEGDDPVTAWFESTLLGPYLAALSPADGVRFLDLYRERVMRAYPRRPDGRTLMPLTRRFLVARVDDAEPPA